MARLNRSSMEYSPREADHWELALDSAEGTGHARYGRTSVRSNRVHIADSGADDVRRQGPRSQARREM